MAVTACPISALQLSGGLCGQSSRNIFSDPKEIVLSLFRMRSGATVTATPSRIGLLGLLGMCCLSGLLAACVSSLKAFPSPEEFGSTATYSRQFAATAAQTCEAARRALLSQGYIIIIAREDLVNGQKSFQPEPESHLQMEIRVVCAPDNGNNNGGNGKASLGFVTALQDVYALKKSNNSASLGVGALGSVSLPFSSSNDAMVKVASKTITTDAFYDRFFELVKRYLVVDKAAEQAP
jgi:Uncharacterized protein conserved in bacteria (DUF2242)